MRHLSYLGVIVTFFIGLSSLNAQSDHSGDYSVRPLFELDQISTGEAYPWISDDGLRIYYTAYDPDNEVFSIWTAQRKYF